MIATPTGVITDPSLLISPEKIKVKFDYIFVADWGDGIGTGVVRVFKSDGTHVKDIGKGIAIAPVGLAVADNADIMVMDIPLSNYALQLHRFDEDSSQLYVQGLAPGTSGSGVAVIENSLIFTTDPLANRITVNDFECIELSSVGSSGTGAPYPLDRFNNPSDIIMVDRRESLFIADTGHNRILQVDLGRQRGIKSNGLTIDASNTTEFRGTSTFRPTAITYYPGDDYEAILAVDGNGGDIWAVNLQNGDINRIFNNIGNQQGQLNQPTGIDMVEGEDICIVSEKANHRLQRFGIRQ